MENTHKDHRKRMLDKMEKNGASSFYDHELVEMLLYFSIPREDTNPIAHSLLNELGGLAGVLKAEKTALKTVHGIGDKSAALINIVGELYRRNITNTNIGTRFKVTNTQDAITYCRTLFLDKKYECFYVICLDIRGKVTGDCFVSEGVLDQAPAYSRKIVEAAFKHTAHSVILTHNHPGGNMFPSRNDDAVTIAARNALASVGIVLNDHIIISDEGYYSYASVSKIKHEDSLHIYEAAQNNNLLKMADYPLE